MSMFPLRPLSALKGGLFRPTRFRVATRALQTQAYRPSPLRTGLYATVVLVSTGLFAVYYLDSRSAIHRYVITPLLRYTVDAETSHKLAVQVLRSGMGPRDTVADDEKLRVEIWGQELSNPVGLAAGFDKDGDAIDGLFDLGFSWVEIGSVTPKPQPGNPRPRVFQLPNDSAVINRYGFPSKGHEYVLARIRSRLSSFASETPASLRPGSLLAVNLGKNKASSPETIDDFVAGVRAFGPYADVLVVNVSSPNTPGLRGLQSRKLLDELLTGVVEARDRLDFSSATSRRPRLVLKIAPDLEESDIIDVAEAVKSKGIDGVIVSNTTIKRPASLTDPNQFESGGLSGPPLKPYTLRVLRTLRAYLPANIPLIGCGGISTGADALEYAKAGASYVQVYTMFGYDGVGACRRIKDELAEALDKDGQTWAGVVQKAVEDLAGKAVEADKEVSVSQLIEEGEELKGLLERLGERMKREAETIADIDSGVIAVPPTAA